MNEINLYKSTGKAGKAILFSFLFLIAGVWLLNSGSSLKWVGWGNLIVFGPSILINLFHLFDRRAQIVINEQGIFVRAMKQETLPWKYIKGTLPNPDYKNRALLLLTDTSYTPPLDKWYNNIKVTESWGGQTLSIPIEKIKVDEDNLKELIASMVEVNQTGKGNRQGIISQYNNTGRKKTHT
ncbi:STM3941 family protein [Rapidithrix thailandica]|uniref:STM3941 family protein n=1 Tax=Rapidithrix thailandica TaxID=413964 RepID=A0AAW9S4N7_9BACT